ncbi:MAG: hypothetical protein ACU84J_00555 [Gammaproteobacteria bacterium]
MIVKIATLFCLLSMHAFAATPYRISRPVIVPSSEQQSLVAIPLDAEVYAATQHDFSDLRLIDAAGVETPYSLQKVGGRKTVIRRSSSRSLKPTLQKKGEDGIVVTLALAKDAPNVDGLTVITLQHDFEYVLQVKGSVDGQDWHSLVSDVLIYDYTHFMNVGNRDVGLPANQDRYFKIVIDRAVNDRADELMELTRTLRSGEEVERSEKIDVYRKPLRIERVRLWHNEPESIPFAEKQFEYVPSRYSVSRDPAQKTTLIDIETRLEPLTGFKLDISTPNFSRGAEVLTPQPHDIGTRLQTIGGGKLEGLHFQEFKREKTRLYFPEQRRERYRVVIHDEDNPPVEVAGIKGIGPGYQLLFLPQPGQNYWLCYGAEWAAAPLYDVAAIQELLHRGYRSSTAQLGPETNNVDLEASFDVARLLNSNLFLGLTIALTVAVLGWSLYRVIKRMENMSK